MSSAPDTTTTTTTAPPPNIGPGALQTGAKSPFILSSADWYTIQSYVFDALQLPTTLEGLRTYVKAESGFDMTPFQPIIDAYVLMNAHCTTWQKTTFPASITLADDIVHYNTKVPIYYGAINTVAQKLVANPNDTQAQAQLVAVLDSLSQQATTYQQNAQHVADQIQQFAVDSANDQNTLGGKDGTGGLVKKYNDEYGAQSDQVKDLQKKLATQQLNLKAANAAYDHDMVVAATSPTYAWIWPFGTIAAAIVAGIYGKKATDDLANARAAQQQIDTIGGEIARDVNLMNAITFAEQGMGAILQALTRALPIIQKIQGVWAAISSDLSNVSTIIKNDIKQAPPIIMSLGVDEAISQWQQLSDEANGYRVYANVKVDPNASTTIESTGSVN
jgi:hypothetical protein